MVKPLNNKVLSLGCFVFENSAASIMLPTKHHVNVCFSKVIIFFFSFFCLRSIIQAKLLQSPEVTGVHSNKLAHPEDEGHLPQENRYDWPTSLASLTVTLNTPFIHLLFGRLPSTSLKCFNLLPYVESICGQWPIGWDYVTPLCNTCWHLWPLTNVSFNYEWMICCLKYWITRGSVWL